VLADLAVGHEETVSHLLLRNSHFLQQQVLLQDTANHVHFHQPKEKTIFIQKGQFIAAIGHALMLQCAGQRE
jgi:hypothetical protein